MTSSTSPTTAPESQPLVVARSGHVVTWTLNRHENRNAISEPEMIEAIESAVSEANADPDVRVAVLTANGSAFSAGGNIKHMRDRTDMFGGTPAQIRQGYRHGIQRIPLALEGCEVPVIAAVNGPAVGAGCDLALFCDIRVASTRATFAESFVNAGLISGDGGGWVLSRIVGPARAAQMAYTGMAVDSATAERWGLVSEVVEPDMLLLRAQELAAEIAGNPPEVMRMTKQLLRRSHLQTLEAHLEMTAAMQALAHHTHDHIEAVSAMLDKRPSQFRGS